MERELFCGDCNMVIGSAELLEKYTALFCIESRTGHLQVRRLSSELLMRVKAVCADPKHLQTLFR